jgi:hypothetical protein
VSRTIQGRCIVPSTPLGTSVFKAVFKVVEQYGNKLAIKAMASGIPVDSIFKGQDVRGMDGV